MSTIAATDTAMVVDSWDGGEMTPQNNTSSVVDHTQDEVNSSVDSKRTETESDVSSNGFGFTSIKECVATCKTSKSSTPTKSLSPTAAPFVIKTKEVNRDSNQSYNSEFWAKKPSNDIGNHTHSENGVVKSSTASSSSGEDIEALQATPYTPHPYEKELERFHPRPWQLEYRPVEWYTSLADTSFTLVDTKNLFDDMLVKLKRCKEFAMDLEHHSYRSFQGLVCIVQISTRTEDFVVDAIVLKEEVCRLNEVCTDASILKVLHGSERDIEWLQRDFGVFIVNLFDTQKAAREVQEVSIALAHILKKYCNVIVNKRYQLADWRIRPIPDEMLQYAREDSHFLLYIKDMYCNTLFKTKGKNILDVYTQSTEICRTLYREPVFQHDSHLNCYRKTKGKLNVQQMECFRLLYEWRHNISKEQDESPGYTLPNKMMLKIAQELPQEPTHVVQCCIPMPPLVHENIGSIQKLVLQAIENVPEVPDIDKPEDKNVEGLSKSDIEAAILEPASPPKKKIDCEERREAIQMINDLFLLQLKLRPELRSLPEAAPLLRLEKKNGERVT